VKGLDPQRQDLALFVEALQVVNRLLREDAPDGGCLARMPEGGELVVRVRGESPPSDDHFTLARRGEALELIGRAEPGGDPRVAADWSVRREDLRTLVREPGRFAASPGSFAAIFRPADRASGRPDTE